MNIYKPNLGVGSSDKKSKLVESGNPGGRLVP